jgi:hypothetical protein
MKIHKWNASYEDENEEIWLLWNSYKGGSVIGLIFLKFEGTQYL